MKARLTYGEYWSDPETARAWWREQIEQRIREGFADSSEYPPLAALEAAASAVDQLFERFQVVAWCAREGCFQAGCDRTHFRIELSGPTCEFQTEEEP